MEAVDRLRRLSFPSAWCRPATSADRRSRSIIAETIEHARAFGREYCELVAPACRRSGRPARPRCPHNAGQPFRVSAPLPPAGSHVAHCTQPSSPCVLRGPPPAVFAAQSPRNRGSDHGADELAPRGGRLLFGLGFDCSVAVNQGVPVSGRRPRSAAVISAHQFPGTGELTTLTTGLPGPSMTSRECLPRCPQAFRPCRCGTHKIVRQTRDEIARNMRTREPVRSSAPKASAGTTGRGIKKAPISLCASVVLDLAQDLRKGGPGVTAKCKPAHIVRDLAQKRCASPPLLYAQGLHSGKKSRSTTR
jgi:hypothetical protein